MSVPVLTTVGSTFRLRWEDEQVVMHLERLYENSHFEVTCEIQINTTAPGSPGHLHGGSRLNLTSSEARRRLAKYLNEDVSANNWTSMLEQASIMILTEWRKGPPVIQLATHIVKESLGMRLSPLLQERQATVFYGEGDTLKSFLALFLAILIATGEKQIGLTPEPGNVLYLDYETDEDTMWQRASMITTGLALDIPDGLFYRYLHQPLAADIQQINRIVLDRGIDAIVVDSAAPAVLEPESASMVTEYFRALRSLRKTSLTIAHVAKNSKQLAPYGSTFWRNLPRANFMVQASRELEHVTVGLKHTKSNNGRRLHDLGFKFEFDNDRVTIDSVDVKNVPELAHGLPPLERIIGALSHGNKPLTELTEELELPAGVVSPILLRHRNHFLQVRPGVWGLKYDEALL